LKELGKHHILRQNRGEKEVQTADEEVLLGGSFQEKN
jgi:hypothetical protein